MQKRIVGYDIMKSLSIYLVVLIHFGFYVPVTGDTLVNNFVLILTNVGVPLFFMVNGALLFPRSLDIKRHYIKTARIIALTLSWKVISAFIMGCIVHRNPFHLGKAAFVHYLLFGNLEGFDLGHFWFMNVLIMLYLIFPILKICFDSEMGREALRCLLVIILCFTVGASAFDILAAAASHFLGITPFFFHNGGFITNQPLWDLWLYTALFHRRGPPFSRRPRHPNTRWCQQGTISTRPIYFICIGMAAPPSHLVVPAPKPKQSLYSCRRLLEHSDGYHVL